MPIANTLSLIISICVLDVDYMWYQYSNDEEATRAEVEYDASGKPYFRCSGDKYYIDEFLRVNM